MARMRAVIRVKKTQGARENRGLQREKAWGRERAESGTAPPSTKDQEPPPLASKENRQTPISKEEAEREREEKEQMARSPKKK